MPSLPDRRGLFRRWFPWFKYSVYALLTINIYLFLQHATVREAIDSLGWVMLLLLFEWETSHAQTLPPRRVVAVLEALAYGLILFALLQFALHATEKPLDLINGVTWLLVVLGIELDIRRPVSPETAAYRLRHRVKWCLYALLMLMAVLWGLRGEALNFYDAFLWILCFFAVELNQIRNQRG